MEDALGLNHLNDRLLGNCNKMSRVTRADGST